MPESINLFAEENDKLQIPTEKETESVEDSKLISHGAEEALKGEYVKTILIPEDFIVTLPNYVIDFRGIEKIREHQISVISNMMADDGDTAIYAYLDKGLIKLGMCNSDNVDEVFAAGIRNIFNNKCKIYKDIERGKPLREIRQKDASKIRLSI